MSLDDLTPNAVSRMLDGTLKGGQPIVQVLSVKPLATQGQPTPRVRLILSDGAIYTQAMATTNIAGLTDLPKNSLVRLTEFYTSDLKDRTVIVVVQLEKVAECQDRLGSAASSSTITAGGPAATTVTSTAANAAGAAETENVKPDPARSNNSVKADPVRTSFNPSNYSAAANKPSQPKISAPAGTTKSKFPYYPIEGLSPYQNKWMIRARVTAKGDIKHYHNARGDGKLFWVNLLDETGEIRATAFNDAVDQFYNLLQEGKVFYIARARVGIAKKQFTKLNNDYELTFNNDTEIVEAEEQTSVPDVTFNFVPLDQLTSVEPNSYVDVIGVIQEIGEETEIVAKASQKRLIKRELTLVDQSQMSIRLTLWGPTATNFRTDEPHPVIAFKGVRVGDFGGRSLGMVMSSTMHVSPDVNEHYLLKGWYEGEGSKTFFKAYSGAGSGGADLNNPKDRKTIDQVLNEGLGQDQTGKVDAFSVLATLHYIKNANMWYPACKSEGCNKKVTQEADGQWLCVKCDRAYPEPEYRYLFTGGITDLTGHLWVNGFNEIGEYFFGATANELHDQYGDDPDAIKDFVMSKTGTISAFSLKAKWDTFNDEGRVRYTISKVTPVDWVKESEWLAQDIDAMMAA